MHHFSFDDRSFIESSLFNGLSISHIAMSLNRSYSAISREIKKHIVKKAASQIINNKCALQFNCHKQRYFCKGCSRSILCKECKKNCNLYCKDFTSDCPKLKRAPFVCNGCPDKSVCRFTHHIYSAKSANDEYRFTLSDSRYGVTLNKPEFYELDNIITQGLAKGQHLYHIHSSNNLNVSMSTIYNYFSRFKPRKSKNSDKLEYKRKLAVLEGRRFEDFIEYCKSNNPDIIELDTVEGIKGGKAIMTLHFCNSNAMVGFLIPSVSSYAVSNVFYHIKTELERADLKYGDIFNVILTDNGSEFLNVKCIENDSCNQTVAHVFFCHPSSPYEKGKIEKNHVHIRDVIPKGTDLNEFTQKDIDLLFCHINSINRQVLGGRCPYDLLVERYGKKLTRVFKLKKIPASEVIQNKLLTKLFTHE